LKFFRGNAFSTVRAAVSLTFLYGVLTASPAWSETGAEPAPTVSIAAPAYWCPYACSGAGPRLGFAVEVANAALEAVGYSVRYQNAPYDRAIFEARRGRIDTTLPTFRDEAPGFVFPQHAVSLTEYCFYIPEDKPWRYTGPDSLDNISFVATSGYTYGNDVDAYIAANSQERVRLIKGDNIPERLRRMVEMGRYSALLDDRLLFESSPGNHELVNAGCLEDRHAGYLALSPEKPERSSDIARAFDRGFERIRADGKICTILEKYGLDSHFVPGLNKDECVK